MTALPSAEDMARARNVVRRYPEDGSVPARRVLAAMYGEESP